MPLARIITRSHQCSRELALDLLARGYTVEIVSPDKVPDNLADLELRVDATPENQLIASVTTRDGARSASLEFLHHLKAPLPEFVRRPRDAAAPVHFSGEPVDFNAEPDTADMEQIAQTPQPAPVAAPAAKISLPVELAPEYAARPFAPSNPLPPLAIQEASPVANLVAVATAGAAKSKSQPKVWREAGFWRAAATFASIMLLASILWFSLGAGGNASAHISGPAPKTAPAPTERVSVNQANTNPETKSAPAENPVKGVTTPVPTPARSPNDYVARDTVTYLDQGKPESPAAKAPSKAANRIDIRPHRAVKRHDDVIAANSVTYFNDKPAAKAPQSNSAPRSAAHQN